MPLGENSEVSMPRFFVYSRYMERSLDESLVPPQDTVEVFKFAISNPMGGYLAWNFFRQHWDFLKTR